MKDFSFNLEQVLKYRDYKKTQAEAVLAQKVGDLSLLNSLLKDNAQKQVRAQNDRFSSKSNIFEVRAFEFYIKRLEQEKEDLLKKLALAELALDEARKAYVKVSTEQKVVGKLKERKENEYRKQEQKEEEKVMDDLASNFKLRASKKMKIEVD